MCHVLEVYIWVAISSLGEIEEKRGIDKNFAQAASNGCDGWELLPFIAIIADA